MTSRETEEQLRKLAALDKQAAKANWLHYLSGQGAERQLASDLIDVQLFQKLGKDFRKDIFLEPPVAGICRGAYALGQVLYPGKQTFCGFGLHEEEWIKHVLITGMTGAGKTNLMFLILSELAAKKKPFIVFDWKRNYRDLLQLPGFNECRVYTVASGIQPFLFNPLLAPPKTSPGEWLMKLVDVIKHAYFVGEGVEYLLREGIDRIYEQCGVLAGEMREVPTFEAVRSYIVRKPLQGRMQLWKASALRVLESLCFRHGLGGVVNGQEPLDYQALLSRPVVLELDTLADVDKIFLTEALILWLYEFRKREQGREQFKHALIIEEGHHILSQKKEQAEGAETIMETCLRQIREFGEAVIVIDQEPTKLSNSIKANSYTKITFNLGNGKDVLEIASCMGLGKEESECIKLLETGHAIVSLKGRIMVPICVRFRKAQVVKGSVGDEHLSRQSFL